MPPTPPTPQILTQPDPASLTLAGELLSLAEAKEHLMLQVTAWDSLVRVLVPAARQYCERLCGHSLVAKTVCLVAAGFTQDADPAHEDTSRGLLLRLGPVRNVTSVQYLDATGTLQTLPTSVYAVDPPSYGRAQWLRLQDGQRWPVTRSSPVAVRVNYSVGPGAVDESLAGVAGVTLTAPGEARQACKMLIKHWFDSRQGQASAAVDEVAGGGMSNVPTHLESSVRGLLRMVYAGVA